MLKNGCEPPSSCRPTMICCGVDDRFSSVNEPRSVSMRSPIALIAAAGCTVNTTFGGASVTVTARTSDICPGFDGSHAGTARTRW